MTKATGRIVASPRVRSRRRALATLVSASVIAAAIAGCSSGSTSSSSGSSDSDILLGATGPLSGAQQDLGAVFEGMKAYFAQVNNSGGINGHHIKLVVRDDQFDPSKTPQQIRQLVTEDKVSLLCGNLGTAQLAASASYIDAQKVPSVALSGATEYAKPGSTIFEQLPDYGPLGAQVAQHVTQDLHMTKVAIAYSPDGIGEPFRDGATAELQSLGLTPVAAVQFNPANADQSTVAAKLKASGAQAVLVNHVSPIVSRITKAAAQIGYTPQWASTLALDATNMGQVSGGTLNGVYMSTPFLLGDSPDATSYRTALTAYSATLDPKGPIVMEGWTTADVCGAVLTAAIKAAGGKTPTRAQITQTMSNFTLNDNYVHDLKWTNNDHGGQKQAQIIQFSNNTFSTVVPFAVMPVKPGQ